MAAKAVRKTIVISIAGKSPSRQAGYTYALMLVAVLVLGILAQAAVTLASVEMQREREAELLFRGLAYQRAIRSYYLAGSKLGGKQTLPRNLDDLLKDPRSPLLRHLRDLQPDPMAAPGESWMLIKGADGGIAGVASASRVEPLRRANFPRGLERFAGAKSYSDWVFEFVPPRVGSPALALANPTGRPRN